MFPNVDMLLCQLPSATDLPTVVHVLVLAFSEMFPSVQLPIVYV